jgi:lambda family phage tail tape measure protein
MAENIDVNVNVNTTQAQRNLANLDKNVQGVQKSFGALKTAIAGIAIGGLVTRLLDAANAITDLSTATNVSVQAILGLNQAFIANGGSAEQAQNAITKLTQNIGEAAQGSASLQAEFQKVGVSLQDLSTLSEEDILRKTITGLGNVNDAATRTSLGIKLLGKAAKGIDFKGLAADQDLYIARAAAAAEATELAGQASQNFKNAAAQIQQQLLIVLTPLSKLAIKLTESGEAIGKFIKIALAIGSIILTFTALGKAISIVRAGIGLLVGGFNLLKKGGQSIAKTWEIIVWQFNKFKQAGEFTKETATGIAKRFKFLQQGISLLVKGLGVLGTALGAVFAFIMPDAVLDGFKQLGQLIGIIDDDATEAAKKRQKEAEQAEKNAKLELENQRQVVVALQKKINSINDIGSAYIKNNQLLIESIQNETKFLTMSNEAVELAKALDDIEQKRLDTVEKLQNQIRDLSEEEQNLKSTLIDNIKLVNDNAEATKNQVAVALDGLQKQRLEQEKLNNTLEVTKQQLSNQQSLSGLQQQLELVGQYGEELENNLLMLDVRRELEGKLLEIQFKQLELEKDRGRLGEARFQQEMAHLNTLRQTAQDYANSRIDAEKKILEAQRAIQENARLGAEQAVYDIAKQFKPYTMAQEAVKKGWDAIGSAVDDFVKTGKFKFSDFARSVLADLAKMIIKAQIFKAISGIAGAFGISLPGLAAGGPAKAGQPYIVGEKGPELFVPKQSGTVVPNNQLGNNGAGTAPQTAGPITNNYNTYNINALDAKSVAQLFAENRKAIFGANKMAEREMSYAGVR